MIGARTLQLMANEVIQNPTSKWGSWWTKSISFPSSYLTAVKTPPAASDVRADVAACQGTAGAKHCELLGLTSATGLTASSMWTWGALGLLAALGLYLYSRSEKKTQAPAAPKALPSPAAVSSRRAPKQSRRRKAPPRTGRFPRSLKQRKRSGRKLKLKTKRR